MSRLLLLRRAGVANALLALACLAAVTATLGTWAQRQLLDTDRWVDTSSALLQEPAVRDATAAYLADQVLADGRLADLLRQGLPDRLGVLAGPLSQSGGAVVEDLARRLIASGAFTSAWATTNRLAHRQFVEIVKDSGGVLAARGIVLDLRPELGLLAARSGLTTPKRDRGVVRVLEGNELDGVRRGVHALQTLRWVSVVVLLAALAGAFVLAPDRARGLVGAGLALLLAALIVLALRRIGGRYVLDALPTDNEAAVRASWRIATAPLRATAATGAVLAALLALAGWVAGATASGVRARRAVTPLLTGWAEVLYAVVAGLAIALVVLGLLPAASSPLAVVLYLALPVAGVAALRRQVRRELAPAAPG